jgi:hypothetical protein
VQDNVNYHALNPALFDGNLGLLDLPAVRLAIGRSSPPIKAGRGVAYKQEDDLVINSDSPQPRILPIAMTQGRPLVSPGTYQGINRPDSPAGLISPRLVDAYQGCRRADLAEAGRDDAAGGGRRARMEP